MIMKYYKALTGDNGGPYSNFDFTPYLPHDGKPGKWLPKAETLEMCHIGWHCADEMHIIDWLRPNIYEVEIRGRKIDEGDKICASQMRVLRKCEMWNSKTARLLSCEYAEHVLPIFEKMYPEDKRPREAIETARKFAMGEATQEELTAARDAAWDAARDAAWDAASAAASAAASTAAWDAASAAAWDAASAAASAAANAAAKAAERRWQNKRLLPLLQK